MNTNLALSITRSASKQTYYTVRFLVDRKLVADAYRAYAYFRWVDDQIDQGEMGNSDRVTFIDRQKWIMNSCYRGQRLPSLSTEEHMLEQLIEADREKNSGLQSYIRNMMAVLDFDVRRRGRLISHGELDQYTRWLAVSVTEAMHYFIGNGQPAPRTGTRYLAVTGAHITHLLRDTLEDVQAGYFNIPREYLTAKGISPYDLGSDPYRAWVKERVNLARACFKSGEEYLAQVVNFRRRIAGYAYITRFERVLDSIERLDYRLAPEYPQGSSLAAGIKMGGSVLSLAFFPPK